MPQPPSPLSAEIALAAARLIAQEGLDYASAKQKALQAITGTPRNTRALLPDNALIEVELRRWLITFDGAAHHRRLHALRTLALQLMQRLTLFAPHLTGAVLNGTATEHSDIHLQLFTDSAKDVEHFLLNEGVDFEVFEHAQAQELIQFVIKPARTRGIPPRVGVVLEVFAPQALHVAPRAYPAMGAHPIDARLTDVHPIEISGRASAAQLQQLLTDTASL